MSPFGPPAGGARRSMRRVRAAVSPLLVVAVVLAGVATYSYTQGAYATSALVGLGAILSSLFVVLAGG